MRFAAIAASLLVLSACAIDEPDELELVERLMSARVAERTAVLADVASRKAELVKLETLYQELSDRNEAKRTFAMVVASAPGTAVKTIQSTPGAFMTRLEIEITGTGDPRIPFRALQAEHSSVTLEEFDASAAGWTMQLQLPLVDVEPVGPTRPYALPPLPEHRFICFSCNDLRARIAKLQSQYDDMGVKLAAADFREGDRRLNSLKKALEDGLKVQSTLRKLSPEPMPEEFALFAEKKLVEGKVSFGAGKVFGQAQLASGVDVAALNLPNAKLVAPGTVRWERPHQ